MILFSYRREEWRSLPLSLCYFEGKSIGTGGRSGSLNPDFERKFIGTGGRSGSSNQDLSSNLFGLGGITVQKYCNRALKQFFLCVHGLLLTWPGEDRKQVVARRILNNLGWPNSVGIIDGTLVPKAFTPQTDYTPDNSGWKYWHSLSILIICDDHRHIFRMAWECPWQPDPWELLNIPKPTFIFFVAAVHAYWFSVWIHMVYGCCL